MKKTKIVCTIGPKTESEETVLTIQQPDIKHSTNTLLTLSPTPDIFPNPIVYEKRLTPIN